ncbi:MAG: hypothetical protein RKP46_05865 [Candidatus Accumulibacter sp.]|uniref:SPOR domain-containing protein n=1 Tax=Accumulibacter sp. TaxID=2053492 RepID=UPI002879A553|nr:hypothetical protein [Accumulibacter sp.]MDS4013870.1 hypothetical protein [Accumulibacter sp.]
MAVRSPGDENTSSSAPELPPEGRALASDGDGQAELKRQLLRRMGVAAMLIVVLLCALAIFDYLNTQDEAMIAGTQFTEPVPVRRKEAPPATIAPPPVAEPAPEPTPQPTPESTPKPTPVPALAGSQQEAVGAAPTGRPASGGLPVPGSPPAGTGRTLAAGVPAGSAEPVGPPRAPREASQEVTPLAMPAASPAPPVLPAVAAPRAGSGYTLQSDLLLDARRAEGLQARLAQEGIPATVETRLRIGPFRTRAELEVIRRRLKELGIETAPLASRAR